MRRPFNERVENFINTLKEYPSSKIVFNPWLDFDDFDISEEAPIIRCDNLRDYLLKRESANYVLIAESPSYGCRFSGIAMTSEEVILKYPTIFKNAKTTSMQGNVHENTATIVWETIEQHHESIVLWNAFAFHSHDENNGPRTPIKEEIRESNNILMEFIKLFPNGKLIAVGRTSENALLDIGLKPKYIRHPSYGGKKKFKDGLKQIVES